MSTAATAGMQAALLIREKQRLRNKKFRRGRADLPSHVATRDIGPFPQYPPGFLCSQGRAAWQERERGRRCSLSEEARQHRIKQTEAHHRWMKRNRIHDASYGGEEEDFFDVYHQSAAANALLYVGLGAIAIGSIIFFVGTGEKGFKTLELRLIGPAMVSCGLLCCVVRILLCACPSTCLRRRKNPAGRGEDPAALHPLANKCRRESARDHRTMSTDYPPMGGDDKVLLHKQKKKVSIVPPNHSLPSTSTQEFKELPHVVATAPEDNVRKISIPQINLPDVEEAKTSREDSIIELQSLDLAYEIESVSSASSSSSGDDGTPTLEPTKKHARARQPANNGNSVGNGDDVETTTLSVVIERNDNSESSDDKKSEVGGSLAPPPPSGDRKTHSGIVLSPLQLGQ
ncbi:unnamed protein product [Brassicogethes aeneus]|uniref:Uncharacterized protein n=1 Tax=Brassicogethes aeneus TaxID=1431903 RepID=A0A9P0BJM2_BRAAE|nr:unnamed protein product [Brassicogethes aeneus]